MTAGFTDGDGLLDPDSATGYLREWKSGIDRKAADTRAMSERLSALRVTGRDQNGLAEVTIDSAGGLLDVHFTDRIHRVAPDVVARAVLSAVRSAKLTAAEQSRDIIAETMGAESLAARTIGDRIEEQLRRD
jgi:DNA-binding protein YbaB